MWNTTEQPKRSSLLRIRRLGGDLAEPARVTLRAGGCSCCCSCCIQVPVGAACGLVAAPWLPGIGQLPIHRRYRWPVLARLAGMGLVLGGFEGFLALVAWPQWPDHVETYVAGCLVLVLPALLVMWRAMVADAKYREPLARPPRYGRCVLVVAALACALGSMAVSIAGALVDEHSRELPWGIPALAFVATGMAVGYSLARRDQRHSVLRFEPHFGRLVGALVGANVAVTWVLAVCISLIVDQEKFMPWVPLALVAVSVWSAARCRAKVRKSEILAWRVPAALIVVGDGLSAMAAVFLVLVLKDNPFDDVLRQSIVLGSGLAGLVVWSVLAMLTRRRAIVAGGRGTDDDAPLCPRCSYNLTGLTEARCPECGHAFDEEQVRQARRLSPFPITTWHPLSTSPLAGALVGVGAALVTILLLGM